MVGKDRLGAVVARTDTETPIRAVRTIARERF
jgi:hypothetical protein